MARRKVAVIGAGFTGLTTAYRLAQAGVDVEIFEKQDYIGGLASGFRLRDGTPLERAYHFLYNTDTEVLKLAEELGMRDRIQFHTSSIGAFYRGRLYPFMTPKDLLTFSPLPFIDRIRTGLVAVFLQRTQNWRALSRITAYQWLRKFNGRKAADILWAPLLRGKFDVFFDKVPMAWLWRRIQIRQLSRDPGELREKLGYPRGGFQILVDGLQDRLAAFGIHPKTRVSLEAIGYDEQHRKPFVTVGGQRQHFDAVAATLPSGAFAKLIAAEPRVPKAYSEKLASIDYLAAVTLVFTTQKPISPYFWHQIHDDDSPFLLLLSLSALVGTEQFNGKHVYYIGDYLRHDDPLYSAGESAIKEQWFEGLRDLFPDFDPAEVEESHVFRFSNAQHIATLGYEDRVLPKSTPIDGVFLSNFSQLYPDDRGTNYAVRDGDELAEMILRDLARGITAPMAEEGVTPAESRLPADLPSH